MPTLHLMVGLPCSGKTTLARQLEHKYSALRLTTDEWHILNCLMACFRFLKPHLRNGF
jgi:Predicted kinase